MRYPIYTTLLRLLLPAIGLRLLCRSRKEPGYRRHMAERLGRYDKRSPRAVWVHGVSVGELQAAYPLIDWLHRSHVGLVVSTTTPAGRKTAESLYGGYADVVFLPYDDPAFIRRFLTTFQPQAGFILETELWPNLIEACRRRAMPLWIVNARLSERSFRRYARFGAFSKALLSGVSGIAAQTERDADHFLALGAACPVTVIGNLKFDRLPDSHAIALGRQWRASMGAAAVVVFASTRAGEEAALLPTVQALQAAGVVCVLVPRHPNRFNEVSTLLQSNGIACARRSEHATLDAKTAVWLGDSLGEMTAYYQLADVAVIGGSWLPFGGQNPIEALAVDTPVIVGPHTFHFTDIVRDGVAAGAIRQLSGVDDLAETILQWIHSTAAYEVMRQAGQVFVRRNQGAMTRLKNTLRPVLAKVGLIDDHDSPKSMPTVQMKSNP